MLGKASNFARRARELGEAAQRPEAFQLKSGMVTAEQARGLFMGSVAQGGYVAGIFGTGIGIATGRDDVGSFAMGSVGAGATLGALAGGVVGMRRGKAGKIVTDAQSYWRATISGKPELMPKSSFMDALVKDGRSQAATGKAHLDGLKVKDYTDADIRRYVNKEWKNAPELDISKYATSAFSTAKNAAKNAAESIASPFVKMPDFKIGPKPRGPARERYNKGFTKEDLEKYDSLTNVAAPIANRPNSDFISKELKFAAAAHSARRTKEMYAHVKERSNTNVGLSSLTAVEQANKIGVVNYNSRGSSNSIELTHNLGEQAYSRKSYNYKNYEIFGNSYTPKATGRYGGGNIGITAESRNGYNMSRYDHVGKQSGKSGKYHYIINIG